MALTSAQRKLRAEINEIAANINMDSWNILDYEREWRTPHLQLMKQRLVRGEVIFKYALIDEFLGSIICNYYFRKPKKDESYRDLWRTKRFQVFNFNIMDEMYLLAKLRAVRAIKNVPAEVRDNIERINALRNAFAHSFFPENRRQYMQLKKVMYRGSDIYSVEGVNKFEDDVQVVIDYCWRVFGRRSRR